MWHTGSHNKFFIVHDSGWEMKQILLRNNIIEIEICYHFIYSCTFYNKLTSVTHLYIIKVFKLNALSYFSSCAGSDFLTFLNLFKPPPAPDVLHSWVGPGVRGYDTPTFLQFSPLSLHFSTALCFTPLTFVLCGESVVTVITVQWFINPGAFDPSFVSCTSSWGVVYPKIIFFVKPSTTKKIYNVFTWVRGQSSC
jgi:hypothetical protein